MPTNNKDRSINKKAAMPFLRVLSFHRSPHRPALFYACLRLHADLLSSTQVPPLLLQKNNHANKEKNNRDKENSSSSVAYSHPTLSSLIASAYPRFVER